MDHTMLIWFLVIAILVALGGWIMYFIQKSKKPSEKNAQDDEQNKQIEQLGIQVTTLQGELDKEKETKNQAIGQISTLSNSNTELKTKLAGTEVERDALKAKVQDFETHKELRDKEVDAKIAELTISTTALDDEKKRIRKEDDDAKKNAEEVRDRIWSEHEGKVIGKVIELCQAPEYQMIAHTKDNLPPEFDAEFSGKFKPDIVVKLEDQFVVFDAKLSKSSNFTTYIHTQVRDTAGKINGNRLIYPMVFFVVPTEALLNFSITTFFESGVNFYVISPEAIPVILSNLKRIEGYALADKLDPQDRGTIVDVIASLYSHINFRNASEVLLVKTGLKALSGVARLHPEIRGEVGLLLDKYRAKASGVATTELKGLMSEPSRQDQEIGKMISPKSLIAKDSFDAVEFLQEPAVTKISLDE